MHINGAVTASFVHCKLTVANAMLICSKLKQQQQRTVKYMMPECNKSELHCWYWIVLVKQH